MHNYYFLDRFVNISGFQLFRNREAARKANFQSNESIMTQLAFGFAFGRYVLCYDLILTIEKQYYNLYIYI